MLNLDRLKLLKQLGIPFLWSLVKSVKGKYTQGEDVGLINIKDNYIVIGLLME